MRTQEFRVKTTEKAFALRDEDGEHLEPSAIEVVNDKYFLAADDKGAGLYLIDAVKGKVVRTLEIEGLGIKKPKWEAMTFDGEFFYIIGSHAVKLDDTPEKLTPKLANRSHLLRFKLKEKGGKFEIESFIKMNVAESFAAAGLYDTDPFKNKLKIEGLAWRRNANGAKELVFALREPSDVMHVYHAALPAVPQDGDKLAVQPFFTFEAGKIGTLAFRLSSIEYSEKWRGFFILTSTEDAATNNFSGNALWFVADESLETFKHIVARVLWLFAVDMKAEGLCILPGATQEKLRLALVFDNDFDDTAKPGKMEIIEVTRK